MADPAVDPKNALLAERTLCFNLMPLRDLDESWLDVAGYAEMFRMATDVANAERWLSRYLIDTFGLADRYWFDFSAPRARLALLDRRALQDVCIHVGLVLRGPELRAEVNGVAMKRLRQDLGAEALDFAFKTAPLIGAPEDFSLNAGVGDVRLDLMACGAAYAVHVKAAVDAAYARRFFLKFPQALSTPLQGHIEKSYNEEDDEVLSPLTRRVMKEVAPQWLPLFN